MQKGTVRPLRLRNGDVSWRIQFRDSTGKQVLETLGRESEGWTKKKAEAALVAQIDKVTNKRWAKPKPVAFRAYSETWFERGQANGKWATETIRQYRMILNRLQEEFGPLRLTDIQRPKVADYFARLAGELSPRSVSRVHTILHSVMDAALVDELVDKNPALKIELPKIRSYKPQVPKPEQVLAIEEKLRASNPQVRFAIRVFKFLGIRWCELQQLRWRDLDFVNARLRIEESKSEEGERVLSVTWELLQDFQAHAERSKFTAPDNYIFCHPELGTRWHKDKYREPVRETTKALGIPAFRPAHDLRVLSITSGVLVGEHPDKLQARAGHKGYATTQGYIKLAGIVFPKEADNLAAFLSGASLQEVREEG